MDAYTHICSLVADFNYLFGVITHKYPNNYAVLYDKFNSKTESFDVKQFLLRFKLINEEVNELEKAVKDNDAIEIIDALCDILYVVAGAKVYFNFSVDKEIQQKIENVNDCKFKDKLTEDDLKNITSKLENEDVKLLLVKIRKYNDSLKELTNFFVEQKDKTYNSIFMKSLIKLYNNYLDKIVLNIFKLVNVSKFNFNLIYQFDIVHNSNMSKVDNSEEDAIKSVDEVKKMMMQVILNEDNTKVGEYFGNEILPTQKIVEIQRYEYANYRKIDYNGNFYYVIFDDCSKKILKSHKYTPAKFI
jgi:hypothetical protein